MLVLQPYSKVRYFVLLHKFSLIHIERLVRMKLERVSEKLDNIKIAGYRQSP